MTVAFAGVDGGGSTCRVRVRDEHGALLGEAVGGAANVYLAFEAALRTIHQTLDEAAGMAGLGRGDLRVGLGLAGISSDAVANRVGAALEGFGEVRISNDADVACLGAHGGRDGGLIVAGTGSIGVARVAGRRIAIGGRGFILGDDGSGARLGLAAIRAALRAHDGLDEASPLTTALMTRFDHDPVAVIEWGRAAASSAYAALAPLVAAAARDGDPVALPLMAEAVAAFATLAAALRRTGATRLSFVGGLSATLLPFLPAELAASFAPPLHDALDGALILAGFPPAQLS